MRVFALLFVAGCLQSQSVNCADGTVCPHGKACDASHAACVEPSQLKTCIGLDPGTPCTIYMEGDGICDKGVCIVESCGDGYITGGEECDGEIVPDDADCLDLNFYVSKKPTCTADCTLDRASCAQACGDHILQPEFEICEDNSVPTKSCVDYGFGAGTLGCLNCGPETSTCIPFGWELITTPGGVLDIHGAADDDIYAVLAGTGGLLHFNGAAWSSIDLTSCNATDVAFEHVWSPAPGTAFLGSSTGIVVRVVGAACTKFTVDDGTKQVGAVWASGGDDAWASVTNSGIWHFDGATWTLSLALPLGATSIALWGSGPGDIYSIGVEGFVRHFTGGVWQGGNKPPGISQVRALWGSSASDIYVGGTDAANQAIVLHYDGAATWTAVLQNEPVLTAGGSSVSRGVTAGGRTYVNGFKAQPGQQNYVLVNDGTGWANLDAPIATPVPLWASSAGTVIVAPNGQGKLAVLNGNARVDYVPGLDAVSIPAIVARGTSDAYAVVNDGVNHVAHWDGAGWTPETSITQAIDLTMSPGGIVFAVGNGAKVWINDGTGWTQATNAYGWQASAAADDDLWILETSAQIAYRWHNASSAPAAPGWNKTNSERMEDIYAPSGNSVFVVGKKTVNSAIMASIQHWNGLTWDELAAPPGTNQLISVWGRNDTDVYAIDNGFGVIHYNGISWSVMDGPGGQQLHANDVWGAPNDLFAATSSGIDHFDGKAWYPVDPGGQIEIKRVTGAGDSVMMVDSRGAFHQLLRLDKWPAY